MVHRNVCIFGDVIAAGDRLSSLFEGLAMGVRWGRSFAFGARVGSVNSVPLDGWEEAGL